jgi:peptide/nickel transport system substrate-binding protein
LRIDIDLTARGPRGVRSHRPAGPRRRAGRHLLLAAVLGLGAVACGGDDDDADSAQRDRPAASVAEQPPAASSDSSSPSITGDADGVDRDATFRYGYAINVSRLDPHRATIRNDITTLAPVYDTLVELNPQGELVGMLATDWTFDDTATVVDLTLREGVVFHDGEPFDAAAVKANIERGQTLEGSTVATDLAWIREVEVVDDHHVRLHLTEPNVSIIGLLSDRPGMMISPAAFDEDLDAVAVGAGPFRLIENRPGDVTIYERFEDYWDPDAALVQRLELYVQPDASTRLNGLRSGQLDATILEASQYDEATRIDGITVETAPTLFFIHFSFNRARSELGNVDARRAIYHAIDREAICAAVMRGLCDVSVQPFPDGYFAANPDIPADTYAHDPERARELLVEAGLPDGFAFSLMVPAGLSSYIQTAEAMQAQLAEVGIDMTLEPMDPAEMADRMYARKEADAILGGLTGSADPSLYFAQRIIASAYANPGNHSTPKVEELYLRSIATADPEARQQVLRDAVAEVVDQVLNINVAFPHTVAAYRDGVVGLEIPLSGNPSFRGLGIAAD